LYDERIELYRNYGNIVVRNEGPIEEVVDKIILAMKRVEQ
jgi:shikimate kinase